MLHPFSRVAIALVVGGLSASQPARAADPTAVQWRTDYNAARKEAQEKGLPILIEIGTENCTYCRKQDATTFRDPALIALLNSQFVPLRIDANQEPALTQALKVQVYPTTVLAASDGKVLGFVQGYVSADQLLDHARRAVLIATTPDWVARDLQEANKAVAAGDYTRAVSLLKGILAEPRESPARQKADQVLAEIEQAAADRVARAKELEARGEPTAAAEVLAEVVRNYAGTRAATDAAARMSGLAADAKPRAVRARELLAAAREEFRSHRYADCLDKCQLTAAQFGDLPEGKEAATLAEQIKGDPDRLSAACEQLNERTAAMYLALAETWAKKGQPQEAQACLEKVLRLNPSGKSAELAQARLTSLRRGDVQAVPTGFEKK
jgi:thioredoxin-like negative regulator of GroEL